jgi:hypothetical protein
VFRGALPADWQNVARKRAASADLLYGQVCGEKRSCFDGAAMSNFFWRVVIKTVMAFWTFEAKTQRSAADAKYTPPSRLLFGAASNLYEIVAHVSS